MEVLRWRTHLHPVLAAAMILILAAWLIILFKRQRTNRSLKQTLFLLLPKVLIVLLLILAYFDPVRSVIQKPKKDKKIMVLVDGDDTQVQQFALVTLGTLQQTFPHLMPRLNLPPLPNVMKSVDLKNAWGGFYLCAILHEQTPNLLKSWGILEYYLQLEQAFREKSESNERFLKSLKRKTSELYQVSAPFK